MDEAQQCHITTIAEIGMKSIALKKKNKPLTHRNDAHDLCVEEAAHTAKHHQTHEG